MAVIDLEILKYSSSELWSLRLMNQQCHVINVNTVRHILLLCLQRTIRRRGRRAGQRMKERTTAVGHAFYFLSRACKCANGRYSEHLL